MLVEVFTLLIVSMCVSQHVSSCNNKCLLSQAMWYASAYVTSICVDAIGNGPIDGHRPHNNRVTNSIHYIFPL